MATTLQDIIDLATNKAKAIDAAKVDAAFGLANTALTGPLGHDIGGLPCGLFDNSSNALTYRQALRTLDLNLKADREPAAVTAAQERLFSFVSQALAQLG